MKRLILVHFFVLSFFSLAFAQTTSEPTTLEGWADRLGRFGKSIPQEQVFVHMDNTCYFLGDTIWYKAYVRRSDSGMLSGLSGVLYAELLNQDGYLVERQQLELKGGQARGSFALADSLYGGYYELRAYTRWQLNWGITEHPHNKLSEEWFYNKRVAKEYYRDYEKLYSRVFPVFDKPKEPGDFYHEMTLRPLRRQSKVDETSPKPRLQLFPEGGNLVAGVPNRVAFEATSNEGLHLDGKVTLTEGSTTIAEADVEQRGRGSFTFTPQRGKSYTVTYSGKKGTAKEHLPSPEKDGCAIQLLRENGETVVQIAAAGSAATEPLGMTLMHDGVVLDFQTIPAGPSATLTLDRGKLKTGVCQVTIYNNVGRVYADRLFFFRGRELNQGILHFNGLSKQPTEPFAPVSLAVEGGKPGATVSVSVSDATHSEYLYDNGNILTEMLLSSQIRGFVENPRYFFEKDDDEHNRALDLLLMVQGWRRFDWHEMAVKGEWKQTQPRERAQILRGIILNFDPNSLREEERELKRARKYSFAKGELSLGNEHTEPLQIEDDKDLPRIDIQSQEDRMKTLRATAASRKRKEYVLTSQMMTPSGSQRYNFPELRVSGQHFEIQLPRFYGEYIFRAMAKKYRPYEANNDKGDWFRNNQWTKLDILNERNDLKTKRVIKKKNRLRLRGLFFLRGCTIIRVVKKLYSI